MRTTSSEVLIELDRSKARGLRAQVEDELRDADELDAIRRLRSLLADLDPAEAAKLVRERIEGSASNAELLSSL